MDSSYAFRVENLSKRKWKIVQKQGAISRRKTTNETADHSSYKWRHKEKMERNNPYGSLAHRIRYWVTFAYAKDVLCFGSQYVGVGDIHCVFWTECNPWAQAKRGWIWSTRIYAMSWILQTRTTLRRNKSIFERTRRVSFLRTSISVICIWQKQYE